MLIVFYFVLFFDLMQTSLQKIAEWLWASYWEFVFRHYVDEQKINEKENN